jgi:hypothetical protein
MEIDYANLANTICTMMDVATSPNVQLLSLNLLYSIVVYSLDIIDTNMISCCVKYLTSIPPEKQYARHLQFILYILEFIFSETQREKLPPMNFITYSSLIAHLDEITTHPTLGEQAKGLLELFL